MGGNARVFTRNMMSIVTLVSGGLDSSLMALLTAEEGLAQNPLFLDYGQLNRAREWRACRYVHSEHKLGDPAYLRIPGWGELLRSGLTDRTMDIVHEAFLPNRNFLFLLAGSAYAYQVDAQSVAIGLLNEDSHLFPDQTSDFLAVAETAISRSMDRDIRILAPLMEFSKADIIGIAEEKGLTGTYSCHAGGKERCGECIACREFD